MSKEKWPFKVGEIVEQIAHLDYRGTESPLCRIISISKAGIVKHKHLNKANISTADIDSFIKIPKLRRILKYGI